MRRRTWWTGLLAVAVTLVLTLCAGLAAAEDAPIQIGIQEALAGDHVSEVTYVYNGALPEPVITVASGKTVGQDIPFSFVCENAETYMADLYKIEDNESVYLSSLYSEEGSS